MSESIHTLSESIHSVVFGRNFALATLFYIYTQFLITPNSLNHLHLFFLGLKNTEYKFFKIKHFFLESLFSLSHIDLLGCYRDCKFILSRRLIGFDQGFKVKWIISFHLQRAWGSFQPILKSKGIRLPDVALKTRVKRSKECTGIQGFEDSRSTKFKGYLKFGGVFA